MSNLTLPPEIALANLKRMRDDRERRLRSIEMAGELRSTFKKFVAASWDTVEPAKQLSPTWSIDAICDHMQAVAEAKIENLIINVPPGSCKSLLVSVMFPAWMWTRNPGWRSMYAAYESGVSTRDSVRCRDLLKSIWFRETFSPEWSFATDQDEKTYFYNTHKGFRISTSVGGRSTGYRAHFLGIDDPIKVGDETSEKALEECILWLDRSFYNRLIPDVQGARVLIMQRVDDRDLSGHLLRRGGWDHLMIPMRHDPTRSKVTTIGWRDPRTVRGELMSPKIFPKEKVDEMERTLGPSAFSGQYQQSPAIDGGSILKSYKWNYWKPTNLKLPPVRVKMADGTIEEREAVDLPSTFDLMLQSWDFAFEGKKDSDPVCGQVHAVRGANRYLLDQLHGPMTFTESKAAVRELSSRWPEAFLKIVEKKANGIAIIDDLKDTIGGFDGVVPTESKKSRAHASTSALDAGNWYLPHPLLKNWVGDPERPLDGGGFIAEATIFDNGVHDDMVDSWTQAEQYILKEKIGGALGVTDSQFKVEAFDLKLLESWPKLLGLHITSENISGVWLAREPNTGQHYIYAGYDSPANDPAKNVKEIRQIGDHLGFLAPDMCGRDLKDGYALARRYTQLGLAIETTTLNVDAEIVDVSEALRSGKLKVFGNLSSFFDEYRQFRRNDKGKLSVYNSGMVWAMMIAWKSRERAKAPLPTRPIGQRPPASMNPNGWMKN